ncbi:MAG: acyl-CoA dehydrogenase family protein [Polyangiaceae bacterium]|nr:acyl-CoA dehydrogenase family protein [Polyangiaceae bacterium]
MKLHYDEETEKFRTELRDWLSKNQPTKAEMDAEPPKSSAHLPDWARAWQLRLFNAGLLVPGWPKELGGRDATPIQQLIYFEEFANIGPWRAYNMQGVQIITPSILDFGTEGQKERFVLPCLRGEITWCLGMSEPGAGSDLAGLSTRADRDGDDFVINGQKVWTSGAAEADFCFCFVRTDQDAPKHKGISVLIIDMKSEGLEARPLPELTDRHHGDFNEVFFDNVRVPASNLVGKLNDGWRMAAGSLAHERGMLWTGQCARIERRLRELVELGKTQKGPDGKPLNESKKFKEELGELWTSGQALKFMGYRGFSKFARGEASPEHSVMKLACGEMEQNLFLWGAEVTGPRSLDTHHKRVAYDAPAPWARQYLSSFSYTIAGGTSEIQRNIIAQRVLGLPRK